MRVIQGQLNDLRLEIKTDDADDKNVGDNGYDKNNIK